jgi:cyclopropane fatty-acyl-phospholipid synthase-like methyltransferase
VSGTPDHVKARVVEYYLATTEASYLESWAGESLGFHVGLADENTTSQSESLDNTNAYLAERAGVGAGTRVLDAGCGVGGSSLWLARERGARVTGVTLVERQVELARRFARERGLQGLVDFACEDMLATSFGEASFDVVWNIESMCHVEDTGAYLSHAAFLLRDNGRFVAVDFCRGSEPDIEVEGAVCEGWALAPLRTPSEIRDLLAARGFREIDVVDLGPRIERSVQALEAMASRSRLKMRAEQAFAGMDPPPRYEAHVRAALACVEGLRKGSISLSHFLAVRTGRA